jgi:hypothetical protein
VEASGWGAPRYARTTTLLTAPEAMTNGSALPPGATGGSSDGSSPYERLGIASDASFDDVQGARQHCLDAVGDDPQARARVEAAYDAVLMERLRERQQGRVSSAALSASKREEVKPAVIARAPSRPALPALPSLPQLSGGKLTRPRFSMPRLVLAEGRERWVPLAGQGVVLLLLLVSPPSSDTVLLALSTLLTVVNLQRRNGRFLAAVGWSFGLLGLGLLIGGVLAQLVDPALPLGLPLAGEQLQSLPALILLLLGALLLA